MTLSLGFAAREFTEGGKVELARSGLGEALKGVTGKFLFAIICQVPGVEERAGRDGRLWDLDPCRPSSGGGGPAGQGL